MKNDQIFETVVTTIGASGAVHVAPMGVRYPDTRSVVLMPFQPSTTLDNITAGGHAVLNIVGDTRVFAGCVTGQRNWPTLPADTIAGARLAVALAHTELRLEHRSDGDDAQRPVLRLARVHEATHAPWRGFNRAQAAVIEGAVLVSRLHLLPADKIDREMAYLQIAIDKTAGAEEHEAWSWLQAAVAAHRLQKAAPLMRLLVSVRDLDEALLAARGGADLIDLKEPSQGALGALPVATVAALVAGLRVRGIGLPISATIGEPPRARLLKDAAAVARCGVDYVKVGVAPGPDARGRVDALAGCDFEVVPVFVADDGIDAALVDHALQQRRFPALMLDTDDKRGGSLLERLPSRTLARFVAQVRGSGALAGLAGALRAADLPRLAHLTPDFAGFRSGVCAGERTSALDEVLLRGLAQQLRQSSAEAAHASRTRGDAPVEQT